MSSNPSCHACSHFITNLTLYCRNCQLVYYCSIDCKIANQAKHLGECEYQKNRMHNKNKNKNKNNDTFLLNEYTPPISLSNITGVRVQFGGKMLPPNSIGGINEDWTSDLPRNKDLLQKTTERFVNSYCLYVKEHSELNYSFSYFLEYYKKANSIKMMPLWWSKKYELQLFKYGRNILTNEKMYQDNEISYSKKPFEPMILRMMGNKIYQKALI